MNFLRLSIAYALLLFMFSCGNEPEDLSGKIKKLENQVDQPDSQAGQELLEAYEKYVSTYPDRHDINSEYLNRAAKLVDKGNNTPRAVDYLNKALKNHFPGEFTPQNLSFLAELYESKLKNKELAIVIKKAAQKAFPQTNNFYTADTVSLAEQIQKIKAATIDSTGFNFRAVNDYINACSAYAMILPDDRASGNYLFDAAQLANQSRAYQRSVELYNWFLSRYPEHPKATEALFISGFILDRDLKRFEEAKVKYETFLEKYPDDQFAKDAKFLLDNLGVPAEDIVKRFEELNN